MSKCLVYVLILVFLYPSAWAKAPGPFSKGHREAMMAGGGLTNTCSPGQFVANPAGLYCRGEKDLSQSFGSTNFSFGQISHSSSDTRDLQKTDINPAPGMTLFSQTYFHDDFSAGLFGSLGQFKFEKSFDLMQNSAVGGAALDSTDTSINLGGFYAWGTEDLYLGITLFVQQETEQLQSIFKYILGGDEWMSHTQSRTVEHLLGSSFGLIKIYENSKWAFMVELPRFSLSGDGKSTTSLISTNGTFEEDFQSSHIKTQDSWRLGAGYEVAVERSIWGFDVVWSDRYKRDVSDLDIESSYVAGLELGTSWQYKISSKTTFASGLRWITSNKVKSYDETITSKSLSAGMLRVFNKVELGTAIAYYDFESKTPATAEESAAKSQYRSLEFTFSSAFRY